MNGDQTAAASTSCRIYEFAHDVNLPERAPRKAVRRLSDKILTAFHLACDQGDFEVAKRLLKVLETIIAAPRPSPHGERRRRHDPDTLVAAHERLWHLRHADAEAAV